MNVTQSIYVSQRFSRATLRVLKSKILKEELNIVWLAVWIRPSLANTRTEQERLICRDNSKCKNLERSELTLLSHVEESECNVLMHVNYSNAFCLTNCAGKTGQRFEHFRYR